MNEKYILSAAGAFIAGIWFAGLYAWPVGIIHSLGLISVVAASWFAYKNPAKAAPLLAAAFFFAGAIRFLHAEALSPLDISRFAGQTLTVSAAVAEVPEVVDLDGQLRKLKYELSVNHVIDRQGKTLPAVGKVIAAVRQDRQAAIAHYGDKVVFAGKIVEPHNYNNPGAYDFAAALKRKGITARASIVNNQLSIVGHDTGGEWRNRLSTWREGVKRTMSTVMAPVQSAVLFGMLFGGYTDIPQTVVKEFAATGIVHILSVSGTHIALLAGVVVAAGRAMGVRYSLIAVTAGLVILLYGFTSGFTPPVVRSSVMGIITLAAVMFGREKDAPAALALSALAMLIYTPGLIYDLSFQLSFAATAGLVFFYPKTVKLLKFLPAWLASGLAVTLAAQLSVLPFLAWYFNSLSLSSFAANIIIVPLIEVLVVAGLLGIIATSVWPLAGKIVLAFCGVGVNAVMSLTSAMAALPGGVTYLPPIGLAAGAIYYAFLAWCYGYKPAFLPGPVTIFRRWPIPAAGTVVSLIIAVLFYSAMPEPVRVHFIDVGQGDAALVTTPHGRAVLIDTGGTIGEGNGFDIGERVVVPYLKHYGVRTLDYLILTHGHQDHAGGAAAIAAALPLKHILVANEPHTLAVQNLIGAKREGVIIPAHEGQTIILDGIKIAVLHTAQASGKAGSNEASTVVRVSFGEQSFLITGDLTAAEEKSIVRQGVDRTAVLKVAHHGARSSTSPEFLQALSPKYAVISVGFNNRYGHPHADTIKRLEAYDIKIFRTDQQGAIVFTTDGSNLRMDTFM